MKTLITGATGFIGSHLSGDVLWGSADVDLTDRNTLLMRLKEIEPTTIIHCAAQHNSSLVMNAAPASFLDQNIIIDLNVLHGAVSVGVEKLLMVSSVSAFSPLAPLPHRETNFGEDKQLRISGYNFAKRAVMNFARSYQTQFGSDIRVVLLGNTYGPGMRFAEDATVIGSLIYRIAEAKFLERDLTLFGDGLDIRTFLYVEDIPSIFERLVALAEMPSPLIVAGNQKVSVAELAKFIASNMGYEGSITFSKTGDPTMKTRVSDNSLLLDTLGGFDFIPLEVGLSRTIDWYSNRFKEE